MPDGAVNGLDACYFSDAVLTGASTMAREAACLGIPAVSFYAGSDLLTVDKSLVDAGKMFFSRNPENIMNFLKDSTDRNVKKEDYPITIRNARPNDVIKIKNYIICSCTYYSKQYN